MLNLQNINTFLETFYVADYKNAPKVLRLKFNTTDKIKKITVNLAKQGYLGCLAFSQDEKDDMAFRLLPNVSLKDSSIVVNSQDITEGVTIASSIKLFLAGRIAHRNVLASYKDDLLKHSDELTSLAQYFGDDSSFLNILSSMENITSGEKHLFPSQVWAKAEATDPLCQVLAIAWSKSEKELGDWANEAIKIYPQIDIVQRLFVTHNYITRSQIDLTENITKLILGDDIFDSTYVSLFSKPRKGGWNTEALVVGVKWLWREELTPTVDTHLWQAVQQYAQSPKTYNGEPHFEVAQIYAENNPILAYAQVTNAAGFYVRATGKTPTKMIQFAYDLASKNNWFDLAEVLSWSL